MIELLLLAFSIPPLVSAVSKKCSYAAAIAAAAIAVILTSYALLADLAPEYVSLGGSLFGLDPLSSYFLLIASLSWLFTSVYSIAYDRYDNAVTAAYHMAILSIVALILSRSYLPFLISWEGMSVSGYFLISYKKGTDKVPPFVFLVFGEMSSLLVLLMFTYFYATSGVQNFTSGLYNQAILFIGLVGFLVKLGITPFQMTEWLPIAHGGAPVNGSVLFSATMTMAALYSIIRIVSFAHASFLIGGLLMSIGAFSLLFAAIYAASSEHVKMLPAYSTIENSGAMLILVGTAIVSLNYGNMPLATFALAGTMVYVFAHTIAKTGLFLFAGFIETTEGTLDLNGVSGTSSRLFSAGGLLNALSLSGMLPFGGGLGEWMMLESLFIMVTFNSLSISVLSTFTGVMAALGAGITLVAMTKFFGFGGRIRKDSGGGRRLMSGPILVAGALSLLIGLAGIFIIDVAGSITVGLTGLKTGSIITGLLVVPDGFLISSPGPNGTFGVVSPVFVAVILTLFFSITYLLPGRRKARRVPVWDHGVEKTREPASFAYANALRLTLKRVYPAGSQSQELEHFSSSYDIFWEGLIRVSHWFERASRRFALAFMNSDLQRYMLYLLLAFFGVLVYVIV